MANKIRITGAAAAGPVRVLVLGAGVVGSVYAGGLLQAGDHVVIVASGWRTCAPGKAIGIGLLALGQFAGVALAGTIAATWAGRHLPPSTPGAVALIVGWFLLGYVFYYCAVAAAGAASSRQAEAPTVAGPLTLVIPLGYLLSLAVQANPGGGRARMTPLVPARPDGDASSHAVGPRSTLGTAGADRRHACRDVRPRPAGRAGLLRNHLVLQQTRVTVPEALRT